MVDPYFTPETGARDLLTVARITESWPKLNKKRGVGPFFSRLLFDVFLYMPINSLATVVQHEVFGHGWRVRTLNRNTAEVKYYHIDAPFPYGKGGGATAFELDPKRATSTDILSIIIGGVEATSLFAKQIKFDWLDSKKIYPREALLYYFTMQDIYFYIQSLGIIFSPGHDIQNYIETLNATYPSAELTSSKLKDLALYNLLDPMTFFALWAHFRYLFTGKSFYARTLRYRGIRYLPNLRLALSPFCPEVYLESVFLWKEHWVGAYVRHGSHGENETYGIGVERIPLYKQGRNALYLQLDLWLQPKLIKTPIKDFEPEGSSQNQAGMAAFITYTYQSKLGLLLFKVGTKTSGFLQGELLRGSIIAKEVIAIKF